MAWRFRRRIFSRRVSPPLNQSGRHEVLPAAKAIHLAGENPALVDHRSTAAADELVVLAKPFHGFGGFGPAVVAGDFELKGFRSDGNGHRKNPALVADRKIASSAKNLERRHEQNDASGHVSVNNESRVNLHDLAQRDEKHRYGQHGDTKVRDAEEAVADSLELGCRHDALTNSNADDAPELIKNVGIVRVPSVLNMLQGSCSSRGEDGS